MILVWGTRLYGRVDDMPGGPHVATRFGHFWYIPLIPMNSSLIIAKDGKQYHHLPIPISFKSILLAWIQAGLVIVGIVASVVSIGLFSDAASRPRPDYGPAITCAAAGLGAFAAAWGIGRLKCFRKASYQRAVQLAERAGMSEEGLIMIEAAYGRISAEDAEKAISEMTRTTREVLRQSGQA